MGRYPIGRRLPGMVATGLMVLVTALWTFWGAAEMYYEGWGNPFPQPLAYLVPAAICLLLTLLAVAWPAAGGWLLVVVGGAFTAWWVGLAASRGRITWIGLLSMFPVSGLILVTGILFLLEGRRRRRQSQDEPAPARRAVRYLVVLGVPLVVVVAVSAYHAPILLTRVDDGDRGARLIEGNGVRLVWAPAGPGWNWKQPWGGYPSWDMIALYGVSPQGFGKKPGREQGHATGRDMEVTGLCRYLSADGLTLMAEPQGIWRLPTTDEIVRSLVHHGRHAGASWGGGLGRVAAALRPDKETPLWAPDQPPIYYWSADEYSAEEAYYVSYNGFVQRQPKSWGNPRHGYRCVRAP